jgi:hypothetical protein
MWLCSYCGLAQLLHDPTVPDEPKGTEPAALVAQAKDAITQVSAAGLLPGGARVAEYGSPHGGSWLPLLTARGLVLADGTEPVDVLVDCFGLMHAADQAAALRERTERLAPSGLLLLQYHSLAAILHHGQWNALRHGHFAYYSTTALTAMLGSAGFSPWRAWRFDLYGGTVLLGARKDNGVTAEPDISVRSLLAADAEAGVRDPAMVKRLEQQVHVRATNLREWLTAMKTSGNTVLGYGAASRAVALLSTARIDRDLLAAVADASPHKQGLRMPGTGIAIISPAELVARAPDAVLVFVPDLVAEVKAAYPEVESNGGRWVVADAF